MKETKILPNRVDTTQNTKIESFFSKNESRLFSEVFIVANSMQSLILAVKKVQKFSLIFHEVNSPLLNGLVILIKDPANNFRG